MGSLIIGNNQWETCISLDFNFHSLSEPRNSRKIRTPRFHINLEKFHTVMHLT